MRVSYSVFDGVSLLYYKYYKKILKHDGSYIVSELNKKTQQKTQKIMTINIFNMQQWLH